MQHTQHVTQELSPWGTDKEHYDRICKKYNFKPSSRMEENRYQTVGYEYGADVFHDNLQRYYHAPVVSFAYRCGNCGTYGLAPCNLCNSGVNDMSMEEPETQ